MTEPPPNAPRAPYPEELPDHLRNSFQTAPGKAASIARSGQGKLHGDFAQGFNPDGSRVRCDACGAKIIVRPRRGLYRVARGGGSIHFARRTFENGPWKGADAACVLAYCGDCKKLCLAAIMAGTVMGEDGTPIKGEDDKPVAYWWDECFFFDGEDVDRARLRRMLESADKQGRTKYYGARETPVAEA